MMHTETEPAEVIGHPAVSNDPRFIALYLPQFHPIPENDKWWGIGFTEWTNVGRAKPLFRGHYQPRIPADLGFYDLRLSDSREAQASLAREYGIEAFCYYHYWFNGRRLLERPFNEVLRTGRPDFPFCLCWANETWSRRWLGEERDILIEQTYSAEDDGEHARWLVNAFADRRYLKINGRPLFLIYRPRHLPSPERTTDALRQTCTSAGLPEPFLVGVDAHCTHFDSRTIGFDDNMNFTPQLGLLADAFDDRFNPNRLVRNLKGRKIIADIKLYDHRSAWEAMFRSRPSFSHFPSVFVGWDNTPRRGRRGIVIEGGSPELFQQALRQAIEAVRERPAEERIVFLNAWNEWAEGNHLEPDLRIGLGYLAAVANSRGLHPSKRPLRDSTR